MGLSLYEINPNSEDSRGHWVVLGNEGDRSEALTGLVVSWYSPMTHRSIPVVAFPRTVGGDNLMLRPKETTYIFTGRGRNGWVQTERGPRALLLFAGLETQVWTTIGEVAYLKTLDGSFVSSVVVKSEVFQKGPTMSPPAPDRIIYLPDADEIKLPEPGPARTGRFNRAR